MKARESAPISQFYLENASIIGYNVYQGALHFAYAHHLDPLRTD